MSERVLTTLSTTAITWQYGTDDVFNAWFNIGNGAIYRGHPVFAVYLGDYLEQLLVTCCKNGTCPKCAIVREDTGQDTDPYQPFRNLEKVLDALDEANVSNVTFSRACRDVGIKPVCQPFWSDLPYVNIFQSITPDILHQLYQGVIKHVCSWLYEAYGADEINARCCRLPPNHQIRLFMKGISKLQHVTGKEHSDICRSLLGLVVGLPIRDRLSPVRLVRSVRAILDFLYLARYPAHTSNTLDLLRSALERFHANKDIIVNLNICNHFRFPKLHSLDHYLLLIKPFGTTDNYDTHYMGCLRTDFAKEAYRATNHRDEFPQMTIPSPSPVTGIPAPLPLPVHAPAGPHPSYSRIKMTKWLSVKGLRWHDFIISYSNPALTCAQVENASLGVCYCVATISVFHKLKIALEDAQQLGIGHHTRHHQQGQPVPARFDTVLVNDGTGGASDIQGYRIGRVHLIFTLPKKICNGFLPGVIAPGPLAYIEWFTAFTDPDPVHGMFEVTRCRGPAPGHARLASDIQVKSICRSCHLFPVAPSAVLDLCDSFWVSPFSDTHMYMTLI
ncbi:hypothetical protein C8Q80DRAFT_1222091 [Daedaleopsis nitida]|nr:hypothetical protein C8Q80DRAFT_1222091 [Daedaleopsis nitida]